MRILGGTDQIFDTAISKIGFNPVLVVCVCVFVTGEDHAVQD